MKRLNSAALPIFLLVACTSSLDNQIGSTMQQCSLALERHLELIAGDRSMTGREYSSILDEDLNLLESCRTIIRSKMQSSDQSGLIESLQYIETGQEVIRLYFTYMQAQHDIEQLNRSSPETSELAKAYHSGDDRRIARVLERSKSWSNEAEAVILAAESAR